MVSFVPRPPLFLVLRFAFSIIHGSVRVESLFFAALPLLCIILTQTEQKTGETRERGYIGYCVIVVGETAKNTIMANIYLHHWSTFLINWCRHHCYAAYSTSSSCNVHMQYTFHSILHALSAALICPHTILLLPAGMQKSFWANYWQYFGLVFQNMCICVRYITCI